MSRSLPAICSFRAAAQKTKPARTGRGAHIRDLARWLLSVPAPIIAYIDDRVSLDPPSNVTVVPTSLRGCWYSRLLQEATQNPQGTQHYKDTFDYYAVNHQKSTWVSDAFGRSDATHAAWIDFGIFHVTRNVAANTCGPLVSTTVNAFRRDIKQFLERLEQARPDKIVMATIRDLPAGAFDCRVPQWFCAGGVFAVPRHLADWFDAQVKIAAAEHLQTHGVATWELNTWALVMQKHPEMFELYRANHDVTLFTGYQPPKRTSSMKIAVYSLAKNEEKHAAAWAESCKEADYRVVTDTGSTDKTPDILRAAGVSVHFGNVIPWRWDEAHNLSMHHIPSDADVCVRLDLDERFKPGWRQAIEQVWKPGMTKLRYMYTWSMTPDGKALKKFPSDRVHARSGYRWVGATHEGLVKWNGAEVMGWSNDLEILHHRDFGKKHSTDLELLQTAVKEMPHDARMHWYLARQMDYENHADTVATFLKYLDMAGGSNIERAYACRVLSRRIPDKAEYWLQRAIQEDAAGPDGYYAMAKLAHQKKDHLTAFYYGKQAADRTGVSMMHTSDTEAFSHLPADVTSVNAFLLGLNKEALRYTKLALERNPNDERLKRNLEQLSEQLNTH